MWPRRTLECRDTRVDQRRTTNIDNATANGSSGQGQTALSCTSYVLQLAAAALTNSFTNLDLLSERVARLVRRRKRLFSQRSHGDSIARNPPRSGAWKKRQPFVLPNQFRNFFGSHHLKHVLRSVCLCRKQLAGLCRTDARLHVGQGQSSCDCPVLHAKFTLLWPVRHRETWRCKRDCLQSSRL